MDNQKKEQIKKSGRKPKVDPARHRYSVSLNDKENDRFLSLFEKSGMKVMAHFITACMFDRTIKTVKIDMNAVDYHTRLTNLYSQFRSIGVNYNQIVKILYRNFSEKKAAAYLFKLENQTAELAELCRKIIDLTLEFEKKHLEK
ncbi:MULTISPECIES: conjugal transfer protein MobA [Sphingobacterium]|uniref:conjugal transfer protein MobA n=1 Tax=Sphingobacterium TaxID=28453 RepID=UPI0025799954|nr:MULTISPECIES: conjugal transfer protein MobA [Sphingobacterium]